MTPLEHAAIEFQAATGIRKQAIDDYQAALKEWRAGPRTPEFDGPVEKAEKNKFDAMDNYHRVHGNLMDAALAFIPQEG